MVLHLLMVSIGGVRREVAYYFGLFVVFGKLLFVDVIYDWSYMKKVFVRSEFNYDMDAASDESGLKCLDESLTKQSFAEEVDINTIMRKFRVTGEMPNNIAAPQYGDYSAVVDFQSAMNVVAKANEAFDAMPGAVRARFHNDPQELLLFCSDEKNRGEAEKLGLVVPKVIPAEPVLKAPEGPKAPLAPSPAPLGAVVPSVVT